jgi:hypothetical protein
MIVKTIRENDGRLKEKRKWEGEAFKKGDNLDFEIDKEASLRYAARVCARSIKVEQNKTLAPSRQKILQNFF